MSADRPARGMIVDDRPGSDVGPVIPGVRDGRLAHSLYLTMIGVCDEPIDTGVAAALEREVTELLAWIRAEEFGASWRRSTAFKLLVRLPPGTRAQGMAPAIIAAAEAIERLVRGGQP